jgi:very-short-patch-repair endonuclease
MPAETVSTRDIAGLRRSREGSDAVVARLAERQYGVVARWQLLELGLGEDAIDHRLAIGRLHPVARGVYAVGHRVISARGGGMAAVLSSGSGAVLSHSSAAALWDIRGWGPGPVEVIVPRKSTSSRLIRRHHSVLPADEMTTHEGIPVTIAPRTVFDLAAISTVDRVESLIRQAEYQRLHDRLSLIDIIDRYPRRRGVKRLRTALTRIESLPAGRTRSPLEARFLPFLRRHRLPHPRLNDWISVGQKRFQVDCHWPGTGQIVELDSWEAHGTRSAFREDRARDRVLRTAGYAVTRISWAQLDDEPEAVASDLRTLLSSNYKRM